LESLHVVDSFPSCSRPIFFLRIVEYGFSVRSLLCPFFCAAPTSTSTFFSLLLFYCFGYSAGPSHGVVNWVKSCFSFLRFLSAIGLFSQGFFLLLHNTFFPSPPHEWRLQELVDKEDLAPRILPPFLFPSPWGLAGVPISPLRRRSPIAEGICHTLASCLGRFVLFPPPVVFRKERLLLFFPNLHPSLFFFPFSLLLVSLDPRIPCSTTSSCPGP